MAALPVPTEGSGADGREEGGGGAGRGDVSVAWRESELEWRMRLVGVRSIVLLLLDGRARWNEPGE